MKNGKMATLTLDAFFTRAFVTCLGIRIGNKWYSCDGFANILGRHVLVTSPEDGRIRVYSLEGEYLATANRKK